MKVPSHCLFLALIATPSCIASLRGSNTARNLQTFHAKEVDKNDDFERCQGHCEADSDCVEDLVCLNRNYHDSIPGCQAENHIIYGNSNYCVRRQDQIEFDRLIAIKPDAEYVRNDADEHTKREEDKLGLCQGDCDEDTDCQGNLVCQQRAASQGFDGCNRGKEDQSQTDYCVKPQHHMKLPPLFVNKDGATDTGGNNGGGIVVDNNDSTKVVIDTGDGLNNVIKNAGTDRPWVVSTSSAYGSMGEFSLQRPRNVREGDMFVLFLSRTDDPLPLRINGWSTEASCFKQDNGQQKCLTAEMCQKKASYDDDYCAYFNDQKHDGHDLATVVYTRDVTRQDVDRQSNEIIKFDLAGRNQPGWAILATVRNGDGVRNWAGVSCDANDRAVFASVSNAQKDDLLMLHFAFDDTTTPDKFLAPSGTRTVAYTVGSDEASLLFVQEGLLAGPTGVRETRGEGGPDCKDVNLSIVVGKKK